MSDKIIVITGSTRGIGFGLAEAFLALGCSVVINGRTEAGVAKALASLTSRHDPERILAVPADVASFEQVQALWQAAVGRFGRVDIWINNAGLSHARLDFWRHSPQTFQSVVCVNLLGALYGSRVALAGMMAQGYGAVYNMEGLGSDGRVIAKLGLYGATKAALRYLDESLAQELAGSPVLVGSLRPGMVLTDMLLGEQARSAPDWQKNRRIFAILGSRVEEVAPWLARRILENRRNGARISYLTTWKVMGRFAAALWRRPQAASGGDVLNGESVDSP